LQRLSEAYGPRGLVVVGVNQGESPERARDFARSLGLKFPIWIDSEQAYGRVYTALGLPRPSSSDATASSRAATTAN